MRTAEYDAFFPLCASRRSCRSYDPKRPVSREDLQLCLEAARLAPSACNRQPWRFVVADAPEILARIRAECRLPGIPHPWWDDVPVFVALCSERELVAHRLASGVSGIPYWVLDPAIAGEHFVLAAESLGLGTCWIGWFREKPVKRILGIPRAVRVVALLTLGHPAGPAAPARPRKPLADIAFLNGWGLPAE